MSDEDPEIPESATQNGIAEIVGGALALLIGLALVISASFISESSRFIQPSFFPSIVGWLLIIAGAALAVYGVIGRQRAALGDAGVAVGDNVLVTTGAVMLLEEPESPEERRTATIRVIVIIAALVAYSLAVIPVGYFISTVLFIFGVAQYIDRKHLVRNVMFAVLFTGVIYALFQWGLHVGLPDGILEGLL